MFQTRIWQVSYIKSAYRINENYYYVGSCALFLSKHVIVKSLIVATPYYRVDKKYGHYQCFITLFKIHSLKTEREQSFIMNLQSISFKSQP